MAEPSDALPDPVTLNIQLAGEVMWVRQVVAVSCVTEQVATANSL